MAKTLIFNFDGTGDEPSDVLKSRKDESISNIYKLHLLLGGGSLDIATPDGGEQHSFYYKGIGTYGGWLRKIENEAVAPLHKDVRRILDDAHNDFRTYEEGDRVAVFGFSRGAALARKFVSEILKEDDRREVAFLGVFDTVAEMGIRGVHWKGRTIRAEDLDENETLKDGVQRAVHIVALDEDRITFAPTLINKDSCDPDDSVCPDRILEVWFPGIHTDIGGSHPDDGLGDLALAFMIKNFKKAMDDGDAIHITPGTRVSVEALLKELKESAPDHYQDIEADDIEIHPMVTGTLHNNRGWRTVAEEELRGPVPRHVRVNDNDQSSPDDYPLVHHSVKERFDLDPEYRPAALRSVPFRLYQDDGSPSEPVQGTNGLREAAKIVPLK